MLRSTRYLNLLILAAIVACGPVIAQTTEKATPRDVVLQALEVNPEVQAQWQAFRAANFDVGTARAGYMPSLDVTAGTGRQSRSFDGRGGYDIHRAEISLTQMLFDGFATQGEVARLDSARQVRFFELLSTVDSLAQQSVEALEDVVRYRQLLALAQENYQQHLDVQGQINDRVSQGVGRRADLDQVDGRVALAESNLLTEASNLHDVTARYLRLVGQLPAENLVPSSLRASDLPASIEDVLHAAYQGNPGFHAAIKNIAAAEGSVKRERAGYLPRVELRARHGTQHNLGVYDDRVDPADFGDDTSVELALTYNLFNGGANRSAIRRSLAEVNQAKSERDQACINLRQQVQVVHNSSDRIEEQLVSLRRHRDAINNVRAAYAEQFQIGQRTLLDVLDAENEYFQASRALINAEHDLTLAHTALLSLTGELLPALNVTRGQLSFLGDDEVGLGAIDVQPTAVCPALAPTVQTRDQLISDVITLEIDSLFVGQGTELTSDAMVKLAALQQQWQRSGALVGVNIIAYNATSSSLKVNQSLADARAQTVKKYLLMNGLQAARVDARGQGIDVEQAAVIAPNASRVEITLQRLSS